MHLIFHLVSAKTIISRPYNSPKFLGSIYKFVDVLIQTIRNVGTEERQCELSERTIRTNLPRISLFKMVHRYHGLYCGIQCRHLHDHLSVQILTIVGCIRLWSGQYQIYHPKFTGESLPV